MCTNPLCCQGENVRIKGNKEKEWMAQIDAQVTRKRHVDYVRTQEEGAPPKLRRKADVDKSKGAKHK